MKNKVSSVSSLLSVAAAVMVVLMVMLLGEAGVTEGAVACDPNKLQPCVPAISSTQQPSRRCCQVLRTQRPCLCEYIKDPQFKPFVNSPESKKVSIACGIPKPQCKWRRRTRRLGSDSSGKMRLVRLSHARGNSNVRADPVTRLLPSLLEMQ